MEKNKGQGTGEGGRKGSGLEGKGWEGSGKGVGSGVGRGWEGCSGGGVCGLEEGVRSEWVIVGHDAVILMQIILCCSP